MSARCLNVGTLLKTTSPEWLAFDRRASLNIKVAKMTKPHPSDPSDNREDKHYLTIAPGAKLDLFYSVPKRTDQDLLLLTTGGVLVSGRWYGELGQHFVAWMPMPRVLKDKVEQLVREYRARAEPRYRSMGYSTAMYPVDGEGSETD
jgi:hypothetical protein